MEGPTRYRVVVLTSFPNCISTSSQKDFPYLQCAAKLSPNEAEELDKDSRFLGISVLPHQGVVVAKYPGLDCALCR